MHTHHTLPASRLCRTAQPLTPLILATRPRPAQRSSHPTPTLTNLLATVRNLHTTAPKNWGPLSMIHLSTTLLLVLLSACRTRQPLKPRLLATSNSNSSSITSSNKTTRPRSTPLMTRLRSRLPPLCPKFRTSSSNNSSNPRTPTLPVSINLLPRTSLRRYPGQRSSRSILPTVHHLPLQVRASIRRTNLHRVVLARIQLPFIGNC
jgi:hypothetical protein